MSDVKPVEIKAYMGDATTHTVVYYREADYLALASEVAALRADAERSRADMTRILRDGIVNAPCPTSAQWKQLQDFSAGALAAMGESRE